LNKLMQKLFIHNRKGQKICVVVEKPEKPIGLAFVMDGLSGFKESAHVRLIAEVFLENGFSTVTFDVRNTFGESEGSYEDATITSYYEDLEDVIVWAKKQNWYKEPFCLSGFSVGGYCVDWFAENYPKEVLALASFAAVISGKLDYEAYKQYRPERLAEWESSGWRIDKSASRPWIIKKLNFKTFTADLFNHDLLPEADKLTMPVLVVVGENDTSCPVDQQKIFFEKLPGQKELHIIKGSQHTFTKPEHLKEVKQIFDQWIKKLRN